MKRLLLSTAAILIIGILLAFMPLFNHGLYLGINRCLPVSSSWFLLTAMGDALFVGCILFVFFKDHFQLLVNSLLAGLCVHLFAQGGKYLFKVLRPEHVLNSADVHNFGHTLDYTNYAMPSGHAATIFMAVTLLVFGLKLPRGLTYGLYLIAAIVTLSRIAVGAHWPADCLVGAAGGSLIGAFFSSTRIQFSFFGIRPIVYFLFSLFVYFSLKAGTEFFRSGSYYYLVLMLPAVFALPVLIAKTVNMLRKREWR